MVLALKYRPKKFSEVVGQEATIKTLMSALDKKQLANAYLFSGLRGSGKTTTARIFAKALQCSKGESSTPCEECENCIMANENRHIDIIEMDAASNRKIEDIKEIIEHTRYKPTIGRYKIFIIDEAHMLTREAENALLKTLEEPPSYVKFILATTDPLKLPATILSRTQHYRFTKIEFNLIKNHLEFILANEKIPYDIKAIELLAKSGNGSLRDTITLLDQAIAYSKGDIKLDIVVDMLGVVNPEIIEKLFNIVLNSKKGEINLIVKEIANYDIDSILDEIISYLKDALFQNRFSLTTIERFFKIVADIKELVKINLDNEFVLSLMLFKMIEAMKPHKIDELIYNLEKEIKIEDSSKNIITKSNNFNLVNNNSISENPISLFEKLKQRLLDRDEEIYKCFEKVKFISFENNILTWESCVDDDCKKLLKKYWNSVIKIDITEIFGLNVKIDYQKCSETESVSKKKEEIKTPPPEITNKSVADEKKDEIVKKAVEVFGSSIDEINFYNLKNSDN